MSSMWRIAFLVPTLFAASGASAAQAPVAVASPAVSYANYVTSALDLWRQLRASSNYRFQDYAGFLNAYPGWPDESRMRKWAENAMGPAESGPLVLAFFSHDKPTTGTGWARLADAYAATGQTAAALDAVRHAWASPDLRSTDADQIWSRWSGYLSTSDHDARTDALLFAKNSTEAARYLAMTSPNRRAAFAARIAMQAGGSDAEPRYQAVISQVTSDAGLMMDRARYLRSKGFAEAAKDLAARDHNFTSRPADVERWYEMLLILAQDAQADRQYRTAYNIARQIDDALPPGTALASQSYGVRDEYTNLSWLAGRVAYDRLQNWPGAAAMFERYGRGGKSLQVLTKGEYWAGRSLAAGGQQAQAIPHFQRAARYPDLFYGQLSLERLGLQVPVPPMAMTRAGATATSQAGFNNRSIVIATRLLGQQGKSYDQALFVQALAKDLNNDGDRNSAIELGHAIGRSDLPIWVARIARNNGDAFYVRQAYPQLSYASSSNWPLVHGITRQESSHDPYAVSHAGARGLMQLMPGTAREQAGKLGLGYDSYKLLADPQYNVMLGSAYFQRMLNFWDGSVPLAVASYNAGAGNVRKWVRAYGDPRTGQVDMIRWIEAIPFEETRGYVQRVIENAVVYDSIQRNGQTSAHHVSRFLGKRDPG